MRNLTKEIANLESRLGITVLGFECGDNSNIINRAQIEIALDSLNNTTKAEFDAMIDKAIDLPVSDVFNDKPH